MTWRGLAFTLLVWLPIIAFSCQPTTKGGAMHGTQKFDTPIESVTFTYQGVDTSMAQVVERTIHENGVIVMKDDQGAFKAIKAWDSFEQTAGHSFF